MACLPPKQLYDCERRDSTNTEVFSVTPGTVSEVTSEGLADGQTIPILVKDETGEFVPYLVDGEQLVLSEDNPSVVIEEEGMYKLDTSGVECPEGGITVTAQPTASDVSTSVTGCYTDAEGNSVPVEIIRYSDGTTPVVYNLGTGERIANPVGEFSQNCCDCEDTLPVQVISDSEQLGCAVDAEGNLIGRVYFVPTLDGDGNMISNRMIMVALDGTVTDPYTGTWEECVGDGDNIDVELNYLCVIDTATGNNLQSIIEEILYDSEGVRIGTRLVDRVTGDPVAMPGGTTIGVCPDECLPEPFSTECFEILEEQVQYDNAGGTDPQLCGAPASGPADGGGNVPFIPCPGNYLITSWIINGAEVITGGPVSFRGQICGSTADGQIGLHEDWARALNLIDGAAGWTNEYTTECANYVRVLNPDPNREYGAMVITDATDASRVWTITNGVRRTIVEERFTRVYQRECDGSIGTIWLNSTGEVIPQPEGNLQPCGMIEEEACVTCETLVLCDTVNNPDPTEGTPWNVVEIEEDADDPEHILHFHMSPADDPTKVGIVTFQSSSAFNTGGCDNPEVDYAISNPSTRTITLDEVAQEMHAFQFNMIDFDTFEPTYIPTGFAIPTRLGGTAYWTGEPGNNVNILPTESNGTGILIWDNPPETLAIQVGNNGGGDSCSNVDFEALTLSTMNRPFLRTICRDCGGNIVSTTDTDMDGVTPYAPVGEVTVCLASDGTSSNEQPPSPEPEQVDVENVVVTSPIGETNSQELRRTILDGIADLQSLTVTVLEGTVTMIDVNGTSQEIPAGVTVSYSVVRDQDRRIAGFQVNSGVSSSMVLQATMVLL